MTIDEVMKKISTIVSENNYPLSVVEDIYNRLQNCTDAGYAEQQFRYLVNFKKFILDKNEVV